MSQVSMLTEKLTQEKAMDSMGPGAESAEMFWQTRTVGVREAVYPVQELVMAEALKPDETEVRTVWDFSQGMYY